MTFFRIKHTTYQSGGGIIQSIIFSNAINDLSAKFGGLFSTFIFLDFFVCTRDHSHLHNYFSSAMCRLLIAVNTFASNSFFHLQWSTFPKAQTSAPSIILFTYLFKKSIQTTHSPIQKLSTLGCHSQCFRFFHDHSPTKEQFFTLFS